MPCGRYRLHSSRQPLIIMVIVHRDGEYKMLRSANYYYSNLWICYFFRTAFCGMPEISIVHISHSSTHKTRIAVLKWSWVGAKSERLLQKYSMNECVPLFYPFCNLMNRRWIFLFAKIPKEEAILAFDKKRPIESILPFSSQRTFYYSIYFFVAFCDGSWVCGN